MATEKDTKLVPADRAAEQQAALAHVIEGGRGYGGYGYGAGAEETGDLNIREYFRIIRKNKWLIATLVVLSTSLVAIASYKVESQYQAGSTVQIGEPTVDPITKERDGYNGYYNEKYYKTQLRLLQMP